MRAERKVKTWSLLRKTPSVEVSPIASHGAHQQTDHGLAGDSAVDVKLPCADCDGGVEVRLLRRPFGGPNTSVASTHTWRQAACGGRGRRSVGRGAQRVGSSSHSSRMVMRIFCRGCHGKMPKVRAHVAIRFLACWMPSLRITPTPCVMLMPSMVVFALRRGGRLGPWCPKSNHRAGRRPRCAGCRTVATKK